MATAVERRVDVLEKRVDSLETALAEFRAEMKAEFAAVRDQIRAGDEETRVQMRVLHEDVISRITLVQEALPARRRKRR